MDRVAFGPVCRAGTSSRALHEWRRWRVSFLLLGICAVVAAALLGACAVKLAPDYDKAIFDGLTKANEDAMKLFASVPSEPFAKRQNQYNAVIGELEAVQVQIKARSTPAPPQVAVGILGVFGDKNAQQQVSDALTPPTSASVDTLVKIMNTARDSDQRGRFSKVRLDFIKESFAVQMAQALAYEKALLR